MSKVRGAFVELQVTRDTMVGEIFRYASLGNAEMLGQARLDGFRAAPAGSAAEKTADGNAQRLAGLNVIISGKIGVAKKQYAGTDGSAICFVEFKRGAGQQTPELHFQQRKPGRKSGISIATAQGGCGVGR